MDGRIEKYLETVEKHLKPLPPSERVDILQEIKGSIMEMEQENLSTAQVLRRLGDPKALATAYLGEILSNSNRPVWNKVLSMIAFYSIVGFSGLLIIPTLGIIAPTFLFTGVIVTFAGGVKLMDFYLNRVFGMHIPLTESIMTDVGSFAIHPLVTSIIAIIVGILLYKGGQWCWKTLLLYCSEVSRKKPEWSS